MKGSIYHEQAFPRASDPFGNMLYVRVGIEEFFKFFQCLLRAFRVNEYRMYSAFWKIFFNIVDEPMTSGGIGIRLVS